MKPKKQERSCLDNETLQTEAEREKERTLFPKFQCQLTYMQRNTPRRRAKSKPGFWKPISRVSRASGKGCSSGLGGIEPNISRNILSLAIHHGIQRFQKAFPAIGVEMDLDVDSVKAMISMGEQYHVPAVKSEFFLKTHSSVKPREKNNG